jgi:hypothetical protein
MSVVKERAKVTYCNAANWIIEGHLNVTAGIPFTISKKLNTVR